MIVVLKQNSDKGHVEKLMQHFTDMGLRINYSEGADTTILGLMGDTTRLDERDIMAYDVVERVQRVTEPFKAVNRKFHPEDTIIEVAGRKIGITTTIIPTVRTPSVPSIPISSAQTSTISLLL